VKKGTFSIWHETARVLVAFAALVLFLAATVLASIAQAHAETGEIRVERRGDRIVVHAQSDVAADRSTIWATLSDYDNLARFIPDMSSSHMIARNGNVALVEQRGVARIGPVRHSFRVLLQVSEHADDSLDLSGVGGDFMLFDARYEIVSLTPDRSRIVYDAAIVPLISMPPLLGVPAMRAEISKQFGALVQEMSRRASAAPELMSRG
jgi:carbon monoxide dehydrogenase subunit G